MKKLVVTILIVVLFATLGISVSSVAFAEETADFDVKFSYNYLIMYASGIQYSIELEFAEEFYKGLNPNTDFFSTLKDAFVKQGYKTEENLEQGKFVAYLHFDSLTDMYAAYGRDGFEKSSGGGNVKEKNFFYTTYSYLQTTVFSSIEKEGTVINYVYRWLLKKGVDSDKILLSYVYGTPYKTITTNADKVEYNAAKKIYLHSFNMKLANKDREIEIIHRTQNVISWYAIAIIFGLLVLIIPLVFCIKRRKYNGR